MSFIAVAGRKTTDVREFLREAANTGGIRYKPERGKKHYVYIPFNVVNTVKDGEPVTVREIIAVSGPVHEWEGMDGKYRSTVCMKGVFRPSDDGTQMLNDGTCPICDKIGDGWEIYRYRHSQEEQTCGKSGTELDKHMESVRKNLAIERKAKETRDYIYLLVAIFRTKSNGEPELNDNGMPEYDLKVMKMSDSRVGKIQQQLENSGTELPGSELIFEYPDEEDQRLVVSKSTTAPVFPNNMFTNRYAGLVDSINAEVGKFTWDGLEKSFNEWTGMTTEAAEKLMEQMFSKWFDYKKQLELNPNAKYMEYVGASNLGKKPAIGISPEEADEPAANAGSVNAGNANAGNGTEGQGALAGNGGVKIPDVNKVFGNQGMPTVKI